MSKQDRILAEEELKTIEYTYGAYNPTLQGVINSHRCLMDANATLSFENMRLKGIEEHAIKRIKAETAGNERLSKQVEGLQTDLAAAKGNALLWRDKATIHQREIEELQNELAAEKAASEIWRRKLHKEVTQP